MSNAGQAILTIVGTVIGTYFGYPALGFALGSLAGQALFPTQLPGTSGPRLNDTRTTSSVVGGPVPEVMGFSPVAGTVIWLGPLNEAANTDQLGKGGSSQTNTTYVYHQSIAIGLCRGPIVTVRRIWENGSLVYDARPQLDDESDDAYESRVAHNVTYGSGFVLYLGDDSQLPDPTVELDQGVDDTPAYRGLAYIVYPNRELKNDQGLRHPNFKFEVVGAGTVFALGRQYEVGYYPPWGNPDSDEPWPAWRYDDQYASYQLKYMAILSAAFQATGKGSYYGYSRQPNDPTNRQAALTDTPADFIVHADDLSLFLHTNWDVGDVTELLSLPSGDLDSWPAVPYVVGQYFHVNDQINGTIGSPTGVLFKLVSFGATPPETTADYPIAAQKQLFNPADHSEFVYVNFIGSPDEQHQLGRQEWPREPAYLPAIVWLLNDTHGVGTQYHVLRIRGQAGNTPQSVGPIRPVGHADDNEAFWTAAYEAALADSPHPGGIEPGYTYGVEYPVETSYGWYRDLDASIIPDVEISLATIVRHLCARAGIDTATVDVSDLEDRNVVGYVVARVTTPKDAIEPLRLVGYFDYVESGRMLRFPTRGKASVRTLTEDDLGAHDAGSESPPAVTTKEVQEVELPRRVRLHYMAASRDYEDGEQLSPVRLTTTQSADSDVECAVAISDALAAQAAEVNWADAWAGRFAHSFALDRVHSDLEVADAVLLPVDGLLERVRIISISGALAELYAIESVRDDDGSYSPVAVSAPPARTPNEIRIYSPTTLLMLDLPALRTTDDEAGYYLAAYPTDGNRWTGSILYRSTDGGVNFTPISSFIAPATVGILQTALAAGVPQPYFDDDSELHVVLTAGATPESRDDSALLDDFANAAAVGADGRWEVLQFGTAELTAPNTWKLTHLLRGRRGTEYLIGTSQVGDTVALLNTDTLRRIALPLAELGSPQKFKALTVATDYATGVDYDFTGRGAALVPFSPIDVAGHVSAGDGILTWTRRDRMGQELVAPAADPSSDLPLTFEVTIESLDDSPTSVLRTFITHVESVTYSAAQLAEDFGPSPFPVTLLLTVRQVSPDVGVGHAVRGVVVLDVHFVALSGSTSLAFTGSGFLDDVGGGPPATFTLTAGQPSGPGSDNGFRVSPAYGSITGDPFADVPPPGDTLTLHDFYQTPAANFFTVKIDGTSGPPDDHVFTTIAFTDKDGGSRSFSSSSTAFPPSTSGNRKTWIWNASGSSDFFIAGNDYGVSMT